MEYSNLLEETLEAWEGVRRGLIEEVKVLGAAHFDAQPIAGARSVRELVLHVLEVGMMMTGELTREDTNFQRAPWPELLRMHAGPVQQPQGFDDLLQLLETTLEEAIARFRAAGELHMLQYITRFDGRRGTRLAWLNHGIAHEMYHRGQLALYARALGLEPALTRRIRAHA